MRLSERDLDILQDIKNHIIILQKQIKTKYDLKDSNVSKRVKVFEENNYVKSNNIKLYKYLQLEPNGLQTTGIDPLHDKRIYQNCIKENYSLVSVREYIMLFEYEIRKIKNGEENFKTYANHIAKDYFTIENEKKSEKFMKQFRNHLSINDEGEKRIVIIDYPLNTKNKIIGEFKQIEEFLEGYSVDIIFEKNDILSERQKLYSEIYNSMDFDFEINPITMEIDFNIIDI